MISNKIQYNPDVLDALANLSSDEVFTPPKIANEMLDLLPKEIWSDSSIKILDPACKSWVFLREAAKRFIKWLENEFPDLQERIDHIMTKQLFWIWITNLTASLSRRSLYCSKNAKFDPNDDLWKYSICTKFGTNDWNIWFDRVEHERKNGNCIHCGASQSEYERNKGLETHAYKFIHSTPEEINALFGLDPKMRFDVIIGNPPYQLSDWGAQASAKPIYNLFIQQAKKLNPKFLSMIVPARWFIWGKGLDTFRDEMIKDQHIAVLHDFTDSKQVFNGVDIKGGVCYFLRDRDSTQPCKYHLHDSEGEKVSERYLSQGNADIIIRYKECLNILEKVQKLWEKSLSTIISSRKPYGLPTDFFKDPAKYGKPNALYSSYVEWGMAIYGLDGMKRTKKRVTKDYPITEWTKNLNTYKVFIWYAYWCWALGEVIPSPILAMPILASPMELCTETFIEMWGFTTALEAENALAYLKTKFFRLLVGIKKTTQHATQSVYQFVPMQDFSKSRTDEELYKKYDLTQEEIDYIETMIKPMD